MSEIPVHPRPRRLADWINRTDAKKCHSLIDKVYKRKNLVVAWERVQANRGSGGVDGQSLADFEAQVDSQLDRLRQEGSPCGITERAGRRSSPSSTPQGGIEKKGGLKKEVRGGFFFVGVAGWRAARASR